MPIELPWVAARVVLYAMARKVNIAPRITVNVLDPPPSLNGLHVGLSGSDVSTFKCLLYTTTDSAESKVSSVNTHHCRLCEARAGVGFLYCGMNSHSCDNNGQDQIET